MNFGPPELWTDGDTCLTNAEDRAGALLLGIFAAILSFYVLPETLKRVRSR